MSAPPPLGEPDSPAECCHGSFYHRHVGRCTSLTSSLVWSSRDDYHECRAIGGHLGVSAIAESSRCYGGVDEGCSVWGRSCDRGLGGEAQGCAVAGLQAAFSDDTFGPCNPRREKAERYVVGLRCFGRSKICFLFCPYTQWNGITRWERCIWPTS